MIVNVIGMVNNNRLWRGQGAVDICNTPGLAPGSHEYPPVAHSNKYTGRKYGHTQQYYREVPVGPKVSSTYVQSRRPELIPAKVDQGYTGQNG